MAALRLLCKPLAAATVLQGSLTVGTHSTTTGQGKQSWSVSVGEALEHQSKAFFGKSLKALSSVSYCEAAKRESRRVRMGAPEAALDTAYETAAHKQGLPELMTEFMVDMKCEGCVKNVRGKLEPLEGVTRVDVDLDNQVVRVLASTPLKELTAALETSGRKNRLIGQGSPEDLALTAAVAEFKGPEIFGVVRFAQVSQELARVEAQFDGLPPGRHGWSVNSYGDLTRGADSTGEVYNPKGAAHGPPESQESKVGNLGNLEVDDKGHAEYSAPNPNLKVWDLIGRAVVVYEGEDDLGRGGNEASKVDGNVGKGIAAAVIARSAGVGQNYKNLCTCDGTVIWESTPNDYVKVQ